MAANYEKKKKKENPDGLGRLEDGFQQVQLVQNFSIVETDQL